MKEIRFEKWASILICAVLGGGLVFFAFRFILPITVPFALAWASSLAVNPLADRVSRSRRINRKPAAAVLFILFLALFGGLAGLGVAALLREARDLIGWAAEQSGEWSERVEAFLTGVETRFSGLTALFGKIGGEGLRERFYEAVNGFLSSVSASLPNYAAGALSSLPSILLGAVVTVIAGFYFCVDRERIGKAVLSVLPASLREKVPEWRARSRKISWRYLRAYLLLLGLTFLELLAGFWLLRVPYALLLALVIAFVDLLPVLGVGTVLAPWAIVALLQKHFYLGFGLLILYGAVTVLRQIVEPRLVGHSLGLHPLVTLFASFAGWKLFGVIGMMAGPVVAVLIRFFVCEFFGRGEEKTP